MARGDLYLYKRDVEAFRVPLADFLWRGIPAWVTGDLGSAESRQPADESSPPPERQTDAPPGLRETVPAVELRDVVAPVVACVLALLAEAGMLPSLSGVAAQPGVAAKPALPHELHPAAAPTVATGEIAGAWARPAWTGPRSAVKRAFFDLLERS